eukprot:683797-Prorocentrum_minimum.AAC.2
MKLAAAQAEKKDANWTALEATWQSQLAEKQVPPLRPPPPPVGSARGSLNNKRAHAGQWICRVGMGTTTRRAKAKRSVEVVQRGLRRGSRG